MPLDAEGRSKRARKAALVSAKRRRKKTKARDIGIALAYKRLSGLQISTSDEKRAITFLQTQKHGVNLPKGTPVLRFLANATGLTRQRIWQIVKKAEKLA